MSKIKEEIKAIALMKLLEKYRATDKPMEDITDMVLMSTRLGYTQEEFNEALVEVKDIFNQANVIINNIDDTLMNEKRLDYIANYGDVVIRDCF